MAPEGIHTPSEGVQNKKSSVGGVWIFSGTTHYVHFCHIIGLIIIIIIIIFIHISVYAPHLATYSTNDVGKLL